MTSCRFLKNQSLLLFFPFSFSFCFCSFQEEKEIVAMMDLRMAYEGNDLAKFEHTLHDKRNRITDDPFVMTYLGPLRRRIRESVLLHLCRPYKKITMTFMAKVSEEGYDTKKWRTFY